MPPDPTGAGRIAAFDHVSLPMQDPKATVAFYSGLGLPVVESDYLVQVYVGRQMINFHQPAIWKQEGFTLRAPAATPPCGDLCFVWDGPEPALHELLARAGAEIIEGPVGRHGGRRSAGVSVYIRDPDGNLLEFLTYPEGTVDDG